jgi:small subunit ribosomal protein S2
MSVVTLEELVNAGVYFGHQSNRWNPKMFPYIYTKKNGTHLIDLVQTACALIHVHDFVQKQATENKNFIFIGTKRQATNIIVQEAEKCNSPYINHRWLGGTLTNWPTIQKRIEYLKELDAKEEDGTLAILPKKEAAVLRREREKLDKNIGGLRSMNQIPDIAIIVDPKREATALLECRKLGIQIIAIVDTNCDPSLIDIPIPGNDDSIKSIQLILSIISNGISQGLVSSKD